MVADLGRRENRRRLSRPRVVRPLAPSGRRSAFPAQIPGPEIHQQANLAPMLDQYRQEEGRRGAAEPNPRTEAVSRRLAASLPERRAIRHWIRCRRRRVAVTVARAASAGIAVVPGLSLAGPAPAAGPRFPPTARPVNRCSVAAGAVVVAAAELEVDRRMAAAPPLRPAGCAELVPGAPAEAWAAKQSAMALADSVAVVAEVPMAVHYARPAVGLAGVAAVAASPSAGLPLPWFEAGPAPERFRRRDQLQRRQWRFPREGRRRCRAGSI